MKTKRLLSFLLALVMVVGLLPMTAFAVEPKAVMLRILDAQGNDLSYQSKQINVGDILTLRAELEYDDGSTAITSVNWELVDDYFATMDSTSGSTIRVTGVRQGTSTVCAVYFSEDGMELRTDLMLDIRDTGCTLTLMDNRNGMYVQGGTMQVGVGEVFDLDVKLRRYGNDLIFIPSRLSWTSEDNAIITVNENNKFEPLSAGVTTLTATYKHTDGVEYTASVKVKVGYENDPVVTILDEQGNVCTYDTLDLVYGQTMELYGEVYGPDGAFVSDDVTWSVSSTQGILFVDNGVVTTGNVGSETITVTYYDEQGFEYSSEIYIIVDYEVAHNITAVNCKVYNQAGLEVTAAMNGEELTVVAQPPRSYSVFAGWLCHGTGKISDLDEETTTLYMGNSDITVEAQFENGVTEIFDVTITGIDYPVEGRHPDFDAEIPADAGYYMGAPEGKSNYINGICWFDATAGEMLTRESVFVRDHSYYMDIIVMAKDGYGFAQNDNGGYAVNGSVNLFTYFNRLTVENVPAHKAMNIDGTGYVNMNGSSWTVIWSATPTPVYTITVENGTAYNEAGEVITSAAAGETVTIVANDPIGGREFACWTNTGDVEIHLEDWYTNTTTFVMPENEVKLAADFNDLEITAVHFELEGFYYGGMGNNLGVTCGTPHVMLMELDNGQNYSLFYDFDGQLGTTVSTYLYQDSAYCLRVQVLGDYGCTVETLDASLCTVTQGDLKVNASSIEYLDDGSALLYFRLGTAPDVELNSIHVTNGEAYYINQAVTQAPAGAKIYLVSTGELFDGQEFAGWKVEYGNVTVETDEDGRMYFIMPAEYVSLSRLTKGAIHHVYVNDIDIPEPGAHPDYTGTVDVLEGFDFYPMEGVTTSGIVWSKQIDALSSERMTAEDVFEPGCTYNVSVVLQALDGYYFYTNEYGNVVAQCYINGSWTGISYVNDEYSKYIVISTSYTIPDEYSITVEGGQAYAARGNEPVETPITSALGGDYVKVVANEEGKIFSHWEIVSGAIKLGEEELLNPVLYFGMPDEDVVIRAVYLVVPTLKLDYPSLSFEDEILYNVYYSIDDTTNVVEMGLLTFATRDVNGTVDNALEIIPGYVNSGSTYMAQSKGVPAKNLGDALYFKVYAKLTNGSYVYSDIAGYHAVAYANSVLNNAGSSAKAKALVVAMLNYGAAAQEYFGYKTDSLMNAGLTAEQQALVSAYDPSMVQDVVKAEADKVGSFIMNGGYSNIWPTVSFEGAFAINFYFTPNQPMTDVASLSFADVSTRTVYEDRQQVWEANGIKLTNDMAQATAFVGDFANPARFYKGSNLTIEYPNMTQLVVACPTNAYAQVWVNTNTDSNATVSVAKADIGYTVTITFAEPVDSFTLTNLSAQTRVSELSVTAVGSAPVMYYWDAKTYATVDVLTPENATGVFTMAQDGSNWGADVEGIAAKAIDETVYVAGFYTSNGVAYPTGIIAYSLGNYCKTIAANGEAFGAATAVYGYYAKAYFA